MAITTHMNQLSQAVKSHPLRTHHSSKHYIPLAERIRETAYVWDKSFAMGRNRAKGKSGHDRTTASTCADCAHPTDNMAHMLLTCTHPDIIHIREDVHQAHHNKLDKLRTRTLPHPWFYTAITKLAKATSTPRTTLSARAQTRQRQAQPLRKQLLLTCGTHLNNQHHLHHRLALSYTSRLTHPPHNPWHRPARHIAQR